MLRRKACAICLLLTLWVCYPTSPTSGQLLTEEELASTIVSGQFYEGSQVRALVKGILAEAHKEIRETAAEAVKEAVIPLMAELAAERVKSAKWEAAWREERSSALLGKVLLFGGAALLVFAGGAALGAAVF